MPDAPAHMTPDEFRRRGREVVDWVADYMERVGELPVQSKVAPGEVRGKLPAAAPEEPEPLEALLRDAFPEARELSVEDRTGGGDHFQVVVASPRFADLPLLEQHRLVNGALAEPLRDGTIHELRIKTKGSE